MSPRLFLAVLIGLCASVLPAAAADPGADRVRVATDRLELVFSLDGASPVTWRACHPSCASADAGSGTSLRFTGPDDPPQATLTFRDGAAVIDLRRQRFTATETETPRSRIVTFQSGPLAEGVTLEKKFEVSKTGYEVVLTARLLGPNASPFATGRRLELDLEAGRALAPAPAAGFTAKLDRVERVILGAGGIRVPGDAGNVSTPLELGDWVGFRSRFWTVLARPDRTSAVMSRPEGGLALVAAAGPTMVSWRYVFYSGPVEYRALTGADPDLGRLLFAGLWFWLRALSLGLLHLLHFLIALIGNVGVAIVALAVSVKIGLMPLAAVAHRLQEQVNAAQSRLQPGIEAINTAYKGEERTRRTLALYREQGVHPMYTVKSLVGFLIQFPVFIAVFDMLAEDFDLYRVPFLWIGDLSRPDDLLRLPFCLPFFGCYLNLLPFLMSGISAAALWRFHSAVLTPSLIRRQRRNLLGMTLLFFVLFYTFPAGMVLYWTSTNAVQLVSQEFMRIWRSRRPSTP